MNSRLLVGLSDDPNDPNDNSTSSKFGSTYCYVTFYSRQNELS